MPTVNLQKLDNNLQELRISNLLLNEKKSINKVLNIIKLFHSNNVYIEFDGDYDPSVLGEEIKKIESNPIYVVSNIKDSNKVRYKSSEQVLEDIVLFSIKNNYYIEITSGDNLTWMQYLYYKLRENTLEISNSCFNFDFKIALNNFSGEHVITFNEKKVNVSALNKLLK